MEPKIEITLLFVGETGMGKSACVNTLAGKEIAKSSSSTNSCTEKVELYRFLSPKLEMCCSVIDSPGFEDTRGIDNKEIVSRIEIQFLEHSSKINAIVLFQNVETPRWKLENIMNN